MSQDLRARKEDTIVERRALALHTYDYLKYYLFCTIVHRAGGRNRICSIVTVAGKVRHACDARSAVKVTICVSTVYRMIL